MSNKDTMSNYCLCVQCHRAYVCTQLWALLGFCVRVGVVALMHTYVHNCVDVSVHAWALLCLFVQTRVLTNSVLADWKSLVLLLLSKQKPSQKVSDVCFKDCYC
jgi:hypothetical protein